MESDIRYITLLDHGPELRLTRFLQLGPLGVGHGETSCILLPAVCKFNAKYNANRDQQARVREFLIHDPVVSDVLRTRNVNTESADLGDILDAVIREIGMPRSLSDVKVGRDKLDALAAHSLHDRWCKTNPVPLKEKDQVLEILEMVV
jgi:alcohol dehydrogenase class IV